MTTAGSNIVERFAPLFSPATIAIVGASASGAGPANNYLQRLRAFGYSGTIYPIHPSAAEIGGLKAYPSLADTPDPIDFAYVAIAAERVPEALMSGKGRVRFVQVMSSGFGESHAGQDLQSRLLDVVRDGGMRLIGPNCLGTHCTRSRVTFIDDAEPEAGRVSILSQSGGLSVDMLRRGQNRGIRFSSLVTLGNCADVGPNEMLDYLFEDPTTGVIGLYLEDVGDPRGFFERLKSGQTRKPVVLLKGGRTSQGRRAAASHTGMLAADDRLWIALARQTGTVLVETLEEFLDTLVALQCVPPRSDRATRRVFLFGNGGGTSVLGTDCLERSGFEVPALGDDAMRSMDALGLPAGSSLRNPIDTPAAALRGGEGRVVDRIMDVVYNEGDPEAFIMHLNMSVLLGYKTFDLLGNLMRSALALQTSHPGRAHFLLVLRSDGSPETEALKHRYRREAMALAIAVFDEIPNAVRALSGVRTIEQFRVRHELRPS